MGGHNAGEVAASLALEAIHDFLARSRKDHDHTWPFGIETSLDYNGNRLRTAVKLANRRVFRESEHRERYTGMGTTLATLLLDGPCAALCGVGDSRVYRVRREIAEQLTRDQTWIETLLAQNPGLDRSALANHPMRHVLIAAIGAQDDLDVTIISAPIVDGDRFVLCTDGVHGALDDRQLARIVREADTLQQAAERLVTEALERDGSDNLTAVVAGVGP
jgi:protein phosphatase